mgnify:FL=1
MRKTRWARLLIVLVALALSAGLAFPAMAQSRVRLTVWGRDVTDTV